MKNKSNFPNGQVGETFRKVKSLSNFKTNIRINMIRPMLRLKGYLIKKIIKLINLFFLLITTAFLLQGCRPYYPPALSGTRMPSIVSNPKSKYNENSYYIGVDASNAFGYNSNEHNLNFRNHFLIINSTKYRVDNIGFFIYGEEYKVGAVYKYNGKYGYYGFGPEVSLALYLPIKSIDIGLGAYFTYAYESGEFLKFRKKVGKEELADAYTGNWAGYISLFPIIRAHLNEKSVVSILCGVGSPGFISPSISFNNEKINFWFSFIPSANTSYNYSLDIDKYGSFTLGGGYKF